jgi:hypothetical protein
MRSKTILVAAGIFMAMTGTALADHGKAGLWQISTKMTMAGMGKEQTFTSQHCMTAAEVKQDSIPPSSNAQCKLVNQKTAGSSFTGDMVCAGAAKGTGHISVTYDSNVHYAGQMTMAMEAGGQMVKMKNSFEGKWISADCGKAGH